MDILLTLTISLICFIISAIAAALTVKRLFSRRNPDWLSLLGIVLTIFFGLSGILAAILIPFNALSFQHGQLIEQHRQLIEQHEQITNLLREIAKGSGT